MWKRFAASVKLCIKSCISEGSPKSSGAFSRNLDQVWHEASISSQGTCRSWGRGEIGRKMMVVPPTNHLPSAPRPRKCVCVQANTPVCVRPSVCVARWAGGLLPPATCPSSCSCSCCYPTKLEQGGKSDQAALCLTFDPVKCALLGSISRWSYSNV